MIIWLASYPKSGNTWVRLFLDFLIYSNGDLNINKNFIRLFPLRSDYKGLTDNVDDQNEFAKNCIRAQERINLDNKIKIFKTHNAFWQWNNQKAIFTNQKNTLGVIYIVRDPRNVLTSILNYFHKNNYDEAFEFIKKNRVLGGDDDQNGLPTIIGSWATHYKSWKKFKINYLLIKYENLLNKPYEEFFKITDFLKSTGKFNLEKQKILKSIEACNFKNFSNQENLYGFNGNTDTNRKIKQKFFNLGPNNKWQFLLNEKIQKKIENEFQEEMMEIGYL